MKYKQSGFSTIELVIASGLGAVVSLGLASLLITTKSQEVMIQRKAAVQQAQTLMIQFIQNTNMIRNIVQFEPGRESCFDGSNPGGCASVDNGWTQVTDSQLIAGNYPVKNLSYSECATAPEAAGCLFRTEVTYKKNCNDQTCTSVQVRIRTIPDPTNAILANQIGIRDNVFTYPINMVLDQQAIRNVSCTGPVIPTGINNLSVQMTCSTAGVAIQSACANNLPLGNLNNTLSSTTACQDTSTLDCTGRFGYRRLGLYVGASACNTGGT